MPAPATIDDFLDVVRKSNQVDIERLSAYLKGRRQNDTLPPDPRKLAALLIRDGLITNFQAEQFLQGKYKGFTLGGYRLLERLGTGGTGTVYLGEHEVMRRRVALKVLPPSLANDPATLERFRREAQAAAALDHPNIVRAFDFRQEGLLHFLVMEYVNGPSLQDVLHRSGPLPIDVACEYVRQAAVGLQHAHEAGLVHRDVKPANLLIDATGTVKILDLGLARFAPDGQESLTKQFDESTVMGTADYLSPEQALNLHDVDSRADIYSLGATLYALLAGEPPFHTGTVTQKLLWHQMRDPRPLRQYRADVPDEVAEVVAHMMAKAVGERYQTVAEVAEELTPFCGAALPQAPNPPSQIGCSGGANVNTPPSTSKRHKVTRANPVLPIAPSMALAAAPPAEQDGDDVPFGPRSVPNIRKRPADPGRIAGMMLLGGVMMAVLLAVFGVIAFLVWGPQPTPQVVATAGSKDEFEAEVETTRRIALDPREPVDKREQSIARLGSFRRIDLKPNLLKVLQDDNALVRAAAARALGALGDPADADVLISCTQDRDPAVRLAAIQSLGTLKAKKAIPLLLAATGNPGTQSEAITALAQMPDRSALQAYLMGLDSKDPTLRQACTQALGAIKNEVVAPLEQLVKRGEVKPELLAQLRAIYESFAPVLTWAMIGPFPAGRPHPPEKEVKLDAAYPGAGQQVKWVPGVKGDPNQYGRVRLHTLLNPRVNVVAYGFAEITSASDRDADLLLGSDDTIAVWVNGKQVFAFNSARSWKHDQNRVKVRLKKGKNAILVRCGNVQGDWEFSVSVSDDAARYAFLQGGKR
jgi:serine/threonine protein kinase